MKHLQLLSLLTIFAFSASAQNVGIGTPTPSDQLHTTGTVRFENYKGANTRIVQMDSSGRLVVTAAGALFLNNTDQAIPDNGCGAGNGITSQIIVTGQPSLVSSSKIAVRINITHTWDAELRIYLYPPTGVGVLVLAADNGGSGDNFSNTLFTDQAPVSITTGTAPFTGQYRPKGGAVECFASGTPLANFAGFGNIVPNGTWTLRVLDNGVGDIGTLNSWSISFSGPESITTADENNYLPKFSAGNLVASSVFQPAGSINIGIGLTNPVASLQVTRGTGAGGTAQFDGTQNSSSFNSGVTENTVIRGGKTGSEVIINDIGTGNVRIADAGGNVGIGIEIPTAKLHVNGAMKITNGSQGLGKVLTSDAGGLATWATPTGSGWSASGADIYNSNAGNVGVGTNAPAYILDVNSRMRIRHNGTNTAGIWLNKSDNTEGSFIGNVNDTTLGFWGPAGAGSYKAVIDVKNGAVGIGVLDPKVPLSFASSTGNKISLYGANTTNFYGLGVQGGLLQVFSDNASSDIGFGYGSSMAFTERMRIKGNGNVGIGTNNPTATLDVVRGTGTDGTARFLGTQYASHFNYSTEEDTYIRGGKAGSEVFINDQGTGNVRIARLGGNVGIGTAGVPTAKLEVAGLIKITGGNPGSGRVLTSDAGGQATWLPPSNANSAFHASANGNFAVGNEVKISFTDNFAAQDFDDGPGTSFNNVTNTFQAPATGVYSFNFTVYCATYGPSGTVTNGGSISIGLRKNPAATNIVTVVQPVSAGVPRSLSITGSATVKLLAGDTISVYITNSTDLPKTLERGFDGDGTYFTGHRVY